ncbi:MAG: PQQ-binding-like beta-propeller repeat protein [Atopobiaceae bacterium]|nr:PQQ-binding-like beta-propeller repeat protein [Atopobiaceae bacterium]
MRLFERNSLSAKVVSLGLSAALACGGVPTQALAEMLDLAPEGEEQLVEPAGEPAEVAQPLPEESEQQEPAPQDEAPSDDAGEEPTDAGQGAEEAEPPAEEPEQDAPEAAEPEEAEVAQDAAAPVLAPMAELADDSYLMIQTSKDVDGYGNRVSGELSEGSVLWANMHDYDWDEAIAAGADWTYQWYAGASKSSSLSSYEPIEGQTAQSLTITKELSAQLAGKYLAVTMTAGGTTYTGPGFRGINSSYVPGPVAAEGSVTLYEVTLDAPSALQVGATLTAHAYKGSYSSKTEVTEGVTFTWLVADRNSYSATWTPLAGESAATLTVPESCEGKYLRVQATAGANTVELSSYNAVGPFKQPGAYTIYTAYAYPQGQTTGNNAYTTEDTLWALARETSGGEFIPADGLTYQWLAGDAYNRNAVGYDELAGQTAQTLSLADLGGKYVAVRVSSKIGSSSYVAAVTKAVAEPGAVNVTTVSVSPRGEVNPGDTISATASSPDGDVTTSDRVVWSWWQAPSASGTFVKLEGQTQPTLAVTDEMMGSYLRASADGGYGEVRSTQTVGPVVARGAVSLYSVTLSGDAIVGRTLTAQANKAANTVVSSSDVVTYVWEYASTKTTSDSSFAPIPGAPNTATFTVPQTASDGTSLVGAYIRVRAISKDQVVSTHQRYSYYGQTSYRSVDPVGPVRLDGGYDLTSVKLASSGQGAQVGEKLTPTAQYLYQGSYSSYETDVPSDAKLTYTWHASDANGRGDTVLTKGVDQAGRLTLSEDLVGREVWCVAGALMTPATSARVAVRAQDDFDLLRAQFATPSNTATTLVAGDSAAVDVYAKRLGVTYTGTTGSADRVTDRIGKGVSLQWYVGEGADGPWTALDGATAAELTVPEEAAGCYLRAVATSGVGGGNSVEVTYPKKVVGADSLEGIVAQLVASNWRPEPRFGTDTNVNAMLREELQRRGIDATGITVSTSSVAFNSTRDDVTVGIGTSAQDNGDITYLWADLDAMSYFYPTSYQQASITFTLERDGQSASFTPARKTIIGWDEDKARAYLEQKAEALQVGYAAGDDPANVTDTLTLPNSVSGTTWAKVTAWESDDGAISVTGSSWGSSRTGTVARGAADVPVSLTATIGFSGSSMPEVTVRKTFDLTVTADPERVAQETAALEQKLENGFVYGKVSDFQTGGAIDPQAIEADVQLPTTRTLGVDGRDYLVRYMSSDDALAPNGYRGAVVRPLPGTPAREAYVTCTITSKTNPSITASKTLLFVVSPLPEDDVDAELALLDEVRANYLAGIINGNDPQNVTDNLHGFQKAYRADDGSVAWAHSVGEAAGHVGIVPVELPGYDAMGPSDQARLFASSTPQLIQHENLVLLGKPVYDTQVTISSVLASERYGSYYERYKDDPTISRSLLQKFAVLAGQDVQATVTVKGVMGADERSEDEKAYTVSVSFIGPDASGAPATWFTREVRVTDGAGTTAADVTRKALDERDLGYTFAGSVLEQIVSPATGQTVANEENGAYWQLWIGGRYSERYANGHYLSRGDTIVWQYGEDASSLDDDAPSLDPQVPVDPSSVAGEWSQSIEGGNVTHASTPTAGGEALWQAKVRAGSSSVSEPLIISAGGSRKVVTFSGRNAYLTDAQSGAVTMVADVLAGNMSLTTRPTYADGRIYVPLNGGRVQAVDAATMKPLWVSDAVGSTSHNATCSTRVFDVDGTSLVVVGTSEGNEASSGVVVALDAATGKQRWTAPNEGAGYFWTDAAASGGYLVMGDAAGTLHAFEPSTGREVARTSVATSAINADLVAVDGQLLVMDRGGVLRKVCIEADGTASVLAEVRVGQGSTAAPTVVDGMAICTTCGPAGDDSTSASIVVVDLATMKVVRTVSAADGAPLAGGIKSPALVSVQKDGTYCYVTCNDARGALYVYRLGDAEAKLFFLPSEAQFCDSPVICDADGNLYYLNDTGVLVRLKAGSAPRPSDGNTANAGGNSSQTSKATEKKTPALQALRSAIALQSTATRSSAKDRAVRSLLSDIKASPLLTPTAELPGDETALAAPAAPALEPDVVGHRLPMWPVAGMACGAVVLALLVLRRRDDEEA